MAQTTSKGEEGEMEQGSFPLAMKPWKTLKDLLVHPKNKQDKEDITECVHKVPCANCDKTYVGELEES